jgi:cation transport regulator ChaC
LTDAERLALIATATGRMGSNADYAFEFAQELEPLSIADPGLLDLAGQLRDLIRRQSYAHGSTAG